MVKGLFSPEAARPRLRNPSETNEHQIADEDENEPRADESRGSSVHGHNANRRSLETMLLTQLFASPRCVAATWQMRVSAGEMGTLRLQLRPKKETRARRVSFQIANPISLRL